MRSNIVPEIEVVRHWQRKMESQREMVSVDGQLLEVLYPGRLNDGRGGDFKDAVILSGQDVKLGDIEIHSCTSGWQAHGHHLDAHYNQVVLHVAWQQDSGDPILLEDGRSVPNMVLDRDMAVMEKSGKKLPCQRSQTAELGIILESLGQIRLAQKAERFRSALQKREAKQVFYAGLLEALGFSKNKQPFLELARQVPVTDLEYLVKGGWDRIRLQSYLLGSAGLLPSQRNLKDCADSYVWELEKSWIQTGSVQLMCHRDWEFYKVRPNNNPVRRIIALSGMFFRFQRFGWLGTWSRVLERAVEESSCVDLAALLRVKAEGYWHGRYDFNMSQTASGEWLLGQGRADEIIVNVVFPFFKVWSELIGKSTLVSGLDNIIRSYPPCETNSIQKHMLSQLKADKGLVKTALRQQGLLHLYKAFCTQGRCVECLLNK